MINFIKDAVTAVSGIKSFIYNTDYRNNFDIQDVEFPCCVLTPIMRTNYDLKNIIRESAELQLSVVDTAPYEYTGDELYAINKRCSDLALQVIANLQVKSKLDKELTFEFILPSGDELISGVMCNLQCTMKQGSCIGAPSYVEVIVQPIKQESITSNGTHIITPSKGFNAMKEVEVDVQVPPPPLEEKQVTITKAKTTEIITPDAEYGLSRVEVSTDIPLESKQITITENGTTTIEASEGFEGIESVEVGVNIPDHSSIVQDSIVQLGLTNEQTNYINSIINGYYSTKKDDAKTFAVLNDGGLLKGHYGVVLLNLGQYYNSIHSFTCDILLVNVSHVQNNGANFCYCQDLTIFLRDVNLYNFKSNEFSGIGQIIQNDKQIKFTTEYSKSLTLVNAFTYYRGEYLPKFTIDNFDNYYCYSAFSYSLIKEITQDNFNTFISITSQNCNGFCLASKIEKYSVPINPSNFDDAFSRCYYLKEAKKIDFINISNISKPFSFCFSLQDVEIINWHKPNLSFSDSPNLTPESIHYVIQNAMNVSDGATARTLTLHASAKTKWQNSEYYAEDLAVLSTKGITIA